MDKDSLHSPALKKVSNSASDLSQPTSPSVVNPSDRKRLARMNRARLGNHQSSINSSKSERSCSPNRKSSSHPDTPLKDDLFKQLLKRNNSSNNQDGIEEEETPDMQLVAEVGTSLLEYCNQLKDELAIKQDEVSRITNVAKELEEKLEQSEAVLAHSSQVQQSLQNRVWGLEVGNQEYLDRIAKLEESLSKSTQEFRQLKDQNKKLSDTLENYKLVEQGLLEKQGNLISDHESEVISHRKLISELKREKMDLTKLLDEYQSKVSILERQASIRLSHSDDGIERASKSSLDLNFQANNHQDLRVKISSLENENSSLQEALEKLGKDHQELLGLLNDSQETIEILKQEKENLMWRFGVSPGSPIVSRSRNPSGMNNRFSKISTIS